VGDKQVLEQPQEAAQIRSFTRRLLQDLRALERMLQEGWFETGVRRIGAEQEVFLVGRDWRPAPLAMEVLSRAGDPHFTTEVALFNLEMNLDPCELGGDCLRRMETQIDELLEKARRAAAEVRAEVVTTGILPTIRKSDLGLENMTPIPRYAALNRAMTRLRGSDYEIHLKGVDELQVKHESVMVESCNASFQAHLQVSPEEFARFYNAAQVAAAPVLAAATNSPMLFGRRLWRETRIALFQQSVDLRSAANARPHEPRVDFGRRWVAGSALDFFQEGISRHRILIATEPEEDPLGKLDRGVAPELRALRLHNGTIYRWNRACYGLSGNKPHLRVENRVLPSGPTPLDEVGNAAFWYGLVLGLVATYGDVTQKFEFDEAKASFFSAARLGLATNLAWTEGESVPAQRLLQERLLPLARDGLLQNGIVRDDVDRYLGVVEERVASGRTGSWWLLKSYATLEHQGTEGERLSALVAASSARQRSGRPVAQWDLARIEEGGGWKHNYVKVEQYMTTDLVTAHEDDALDLVANLMIWEKVRHVPVEDAHNRLVGLVSYRAILRALVRVAQEGRTDPIAVSEVMKRDPWTVSPETSTLVAIEVMRRHDVGCLPVVRDGRLVGMIWARNLMGIAAKLLEEKFRE
jgi:CBS domain-containing protein/gamma-glutamylcysteine synthetase